MDVVLLYLGLCCRHLGDGDLGRSRCRTMSFVGVGAFEELGVEGVSSVVMVLECVYLLTAGGLGPSLA